MKTRATCDEGEPPVVSLAVLDDAGNWFTATEEFASVGAAKAAAADLLSKFTNPAAVRVLEYRADAVYITQAPTVGRSVMRYDTPVRVCDFEPGGEPDAGSPGVAALAVPLVAFLAFAAYCVYCLTGR